MLRNLFQPQTAPAGAATVKTTKPATLHTQMQATDAPFVIDVRSPEEYAYDGHIGGSRLLPLPQLAMRIEELPRDRPIVCVCRSGNRSHVACELLLRQGFTDVTNLTGGMIAWRSAGLPLGA